MRDFTLAAHTSKELQQCQRSFVEVMMENLREKHTAVYVSTHFGFHITTGHIMPLKEDPLVQKLLLDANIVGKLSATIPDIVDQTLSALDAAAIDDLALWMQDAQGDAWSAAQLWRILGMFSLVGDEAKAVYLQKSLSALQAIPPGGPQHSLEMEFDVRYKIFSIYGTASEKDQCLDWFNAVDSQALSTLDKQSKMAYYSTLGHALLGTL